VHASGGTAMMQAAGTAARETAARAGTAPPLVIAVTVLTSMTAETLAEIYGRSEDSPGSGIRGAGSGGAGSGGAGSGIRGSVLERVVRLAQLAEAAGLDGVVASPLETATIREHCGRDFAIVTPGIRGGGAGAAGNDDQARTMSAGEAIAAGASYIVVGRPIIAARDPRAAAEAIVEEARRGAPTSR